METIGGDPEAVGIILNPKGGVHVISTPEIVSLLVIDS